LIMKGPVDRGPWRITALVYMSASDTTPNNILKSKSHIVMKE